MNDEYKLKLISNKCKHNGNLTVKLFNIHKYTIQILSCEPRIATKTTVIFY